MAFWSYHYFLWQIAPTELEALRHIKWLMVGASFIPYFFMGFTLQYLKKKNLVILNWLNLSLAIILSFSMWSPLMIGSIEPTMGFQFWPHGGLLFPLFMLYFSSNVIGSFILMYQRYKATKNPNDLTLFIATLIAFTGGSTNFFLWFNIPIPPVGNSFILLYVLVMSAAIVRRGILDIDFLLTRFISYVATLCVMGLGFWGFEFYVVPQLHVSYTSSSLIVLGNLFFFMFAIQLYPKLKEKIESLPRRLLLRNKLVFNQLKKEFIRATESISSITQFREAIHRFLSTHTLTTSIDLYLNTEFGKPYTDFVEYKALNSNVLQAQMAFNQNHHLIQILVAKKTPITYTEASEEIQETMGLLGARIIIPCFSTQQLEGFILVKTDSPKKFFSFEEVQLFEFMVISLPRVFERLRDYAQLESHIALQDLEIEKKEQLERDLLRAKEVQKKLLPTQVPAPKEITFDAVFKPARVVSGDYYDFFTYTDTKYGVILADIVGKGMPAAFLMMYFRTIITNNLPDRNKLQEDIEHLNRTVYHNSVFDKYTPIIYGVIDTEALTFTYINAGHEDGLLLSGDTITPLPSTGAPLGLDHNETYEINTIQLKPKDVIILYTDGLTDAHNKHNEVYGMDRLKSELLRYKQPENNAFSAAQFLDEKLNIYTNRTNAQKDDITIVTAEVNSHPSTL